jgi:cytidylate kinase
MIITISGTPGSGKSTIAKAVAKKLKYKHYSMGDLQRIYATEKGISILQLGKLEETDESIDKEIDQKQVELGKKEDNFIIDSRLGSYFIPQAKYKIFLDADKKARAGRIMKDKRNVEKYKTEKEALKAMDDREECNSRRYKKLYGVDHFDKKLYTHFIDTTDLNPEDVVEKVLAILKQKL